jgi:hypothetical protein
LFWMPIGYNLFEELSKKELCGSFDYAGIDNFNIPYGGRLGRKHTTIDCSSFLYGCMVYFGFKITHFTDFKTHFTESTFVMYF